MNEKSGLEYLLLNQIMEWALPIPDREHIFHPTRKWRFDFAWPEWKIAVEVEGGIWHRGRHVRGSGFIQDCEKYNAATELGWRVFRYTRGDIEDLKAIEQIKRVLTNKPSGEG